MQALNPEQARAFLVTARGDRLEDKRLSVRRILSAAKNGPTFTTPKNNKSRSVRLTPGAVEALHAHRRRQ
jgi:hypothetical protein